MRGCRRRSLYSRVGLHQQFARGQQKIFVTSLTYNVELVHTPNFTYTMANADNACQARAAAAGLSGTYLALMYETVLSELNNCNKITVLRYPTDILPAAALWNGQKIDGTNCEWHLIATNGSDMFSVDPDGNYLRNPIKYNEFGTLTDARVFTNFQPTGNGGYDRMNTCLQNSTCNYITGGATRGCFYGYSTSKDANWAGAYSPLNGMGLCATPCMDASSQKRFIACSNDSSGFRYAPSRNFTDFQKRTLTGSFFEISARIIGAGPPIFFVRR